METTVLPLTSLPSEPATGIQTRSEAQPSGEFAKILQSQPAQTEKPSGKNSEGQEEDQLPATGKEISVLLFSLLPALLPEMQGPSGEMGLGAASSGSQNLGNDGAAQILAIPIPDAGTKEGSTAVVQKVSVQRESLVSVGKVIQSWTAPKRKLFAGRFSRRNCNPWEGDSKFFACRKGPDQRPGSAALA